MTYFSFQNFEFSDTICDFLTAVCEISLLMFDFFPFTDPGFDYYYQWPCNHQYDYYDYCPYQIFPDCCADDCAVQCYPNYPIDPIGKIIDFLTPEGVKSWYLSLLCKITVFKWASGVTRVKKCQIHIHLNLLC